ncbi:MAG: M48 family metalloprotease [Algoriphagus sp.]
MPEVAIYEGEPNAFATGAFRNSALVAVSTGLLQGMTREEVEAVLHYLAKLLPHVPQVGRHDGNGRN